MQSYAPSGMSAATRYNLPIGLPSADASELHAMGRPGLEDVTTSKWWHIDSPLAWAGGLIALLVGAAAVSGSGSVRVGPIHASASAGAGKK